MRPFSSADVFFFCHFGAVSVQFSHELCTSGYKYDTFSFCSSNLPDYKIDASQRDFFHFQDGYHDFKDGRQIDDIFPYNKNIKMSSFKSSENIQKKEGFCTTKAL